MHPDDVLGYIVVTVVLIIPALGLTARFILAPLLQTMRSRREALPPELNERVAALEAEVRELKDQNAAVHQDIEALRSAEAFYRDLQLTPPAGPPR